MNWLLLLAVFGLAASVQPLDNVLNHKQPLEKAFRHVYEKAQPFRNDLKHFQPSKHVKPYLEKNGDNKLLNKVSI